MDDVFRALGDPTRRRLLDELFKRDGQTLSALERRLPMTRFGVMKHLRLLESAGLVVTKRRGREKLHFLNPVPIRRVHDRWVSKYAEPWAATLTNLKHTLEEATMEKVFEIYIKTTPERLWQAITDTEMRRKYTFGAVVTSSWKKGSRYDAVGQGTLIFEGENLEVDPPRKLVQSFRALWGEDVKSEWDYAVRRVKALREREKEKAEGKPPPDPAKERKLPEPFFNLELVKLFVPVPAPTPPAPLPSEKKAEPLPPAAKS